MFKEYGGENNTRWIRRILWSSFCLVFLAALTAPLALKIYLASPLAAAQISRLLTSHLHQPLKIGGVQTEGFTLHLKGITLGNPTYFQAGNLVSIDHLSISPCWGDILLGRRSFDLVALEGFRLDLHSDNTGIWNFTDLQRRFSGGKPGPELLIRQFSVKGGSILVNGRGPKGISLRIQKLTTKGSTDSRIELSFEDVAGDRFLIKGRARPGSDPSFDLSLTGTDLSLKNLAALGSDRQLKLDGKCTIRLSAEYGKGQLSTSGNVGFSRIPMTAGRVTTSIDGNLDFSGTYNVMQDRVRMERVTLTLMELLKVTAAGTIDEIKGEKRFIFDIGLDEINMKKLAILLPPDLRSKGAISGKLSSRGIHLAGSGRKGLTAVKGSFALDGGRVTTGDRLITQGLFGRVAFSMTGDRILAKGGLFQAESDEKPTLEKLDAPFSVTLSQRMRPLLAEVSPFSARIAGFPLLGRLGFSPSTSVPLHVSMQIPRTPTAKLNPFLEGLNLRFIEGSAALTLEGSGRGATDFSGTAMARVADIQGNKDDTVFAIGSGESSCRFDRVNGRFTATGDIGVAKTVVGGKDGEARFSYSLLDGSISLYDGAFRLDGTAVAFTRLTARIPLKDKGADSVRYPLTLEFNGCDVRHGEANLTGIAGRVQAIHAQDSRRKWLEGTADISEGRVLWGTNSIAAPSAHLTLSQSGVKGEISGSFLGGRLNGSMAFNPFLPAEGGSFDMGITGTALAAAGKLLPPKPGINIVDGLLDASIKGSYTGKEGLSSRLEAKGSGVALAGVGGKRILTGGEMTLFAEIAGRRLYLKEARLTAGDEIQLKVEGELDNASSPDREGDFTVSLARTSCNSLLDTFVNILPRFLQESTVDGTVAAEGKLKLHRGRKLLEGSLQLDGVKLEVASQKLSAGSIDGTLPFSIDFSGGVPGMPRNPLNFNRENFPLLVEALRQPARSSRVVRIEKVRFGTLELGETTLHSRAANGINEILSFRSSLNEGDLLGRGFVFLRNGIHYGGDLLVNGLSLKQTCSTFPKIKGYISGRLDSIVSIADEGSAKTGMIGLIDIWAREGEGEPMQISREFLQRLANKQLSGFFFHDDRPYDRAEISASLDNGVLTFEGFDISHTNFFGIRDLSLTVMSDQNRISLDHLFDSIKQAAARGKAATGEPLPADTQPDQGFKWDE